VGRIGTHKKNKVNERYSRQILFREIGKAGQQKLLNSRILLVGCGALGASHAEMLARAGVGKIRIADRDFVEFTNLQRQTLYSESDAHERLPKAVAAKNRIAEINSEVNVEAIIADINHSNIESLIKDCDLVIDGADNFQVRYIVNDACVKLGKVWIYGAAVSSYGATMTIIPGETPCLRCIFEEIPDAGSSPTCDTAGVIMPVITQISSVQVTEALKVLTGNTAALHRSLMQIDVWRNDWRKIKLASAEPDCKACGQHIFEFLDAEERELSAVLCGRDAVQIIPPKPTDLDLAALAERLRNFTDVKQNHYLVRFTTGENEVTVFRDARAIIKGTADTATARSLYAKFIGI
jgi:molybdopterin-synthase adenylyltransferase